MFFKPNEDFKGVIKRILKNEEIKQIKRKKDGWTNIVYEVQGEKNDFIFRFPRDEFWSRTIIKDYQFARFIYLKTDFITSKLEIYYDNDRPFSVHKKIKGTPLSQKMATLTPQEIEIVSEDIAKFMYQLHSIKYKKEDVFKIQNIHLDLPHFLDEMLNFHIEKKNLTFWHFTEEEDNHLVHGDFNASNILLDDDNRVIAVIDFGFGGFGNEYDDIARIISRTSNEFNIPIIKNYEKFSHNKLDYHKVAKKVNIWKQIDQSYIDYMKERGIYEDPYVNKR